MNTNYQTLLGVVIKAEIDGCPRHELILDICETPQSLLDCGFSQRNVIIKAKTVGKAFFDHGLTQRQLERIEELLTKPQAIYQSETQPGRVVVFTYETHGSSPVLIPVAKDHSVGRVALAHEVLSMYGKDGPDPRPRWDAAGLLIQKF